MNNKARFFWLIIAVLISVLGLTLIPIVGFALQEEKTYLPVILVLETPTPIPTPTPTPEPTAVRPKLRDGYYYATLTGEVGGSISFRVRDNGETAYRASFIYYWHNPPGCGAMSWSFPSSSSIGNGQLSFFAFELLTILAKMDCSSITSTSASCTVQKFSYGGPWLGACGRPVTKTVHRQN